MGSQPDAAFVTLLVTHQDRIRSYVAGMGVPLGDVDDVAQEVFVIYYRDQERRPPEVEPLAWLRGIARNLCNYYFRRQGRVSRLWEEIARALEGAASPLEQPATDDRLIAALGRCLEGLPARQREMLRWYYQDDQSAEEIGRRVGRSAGAIRVAMLRLREALRTCIGRQIVQEHLS